MTAGSFFTTSGSPSAIRSPLSSTKEALAEREDRIHVVADDNDRFAVAVDPVYVLENNFHQLRVYAGKRFIQNHDVRIEHEQPAKLKKLLLASGKRLGVFIAQMFHGQERQYLPGPLAEIPLTGCRVHRKRRYIEILQNCHAPEGPGHLKSAAETLPEPLCKAAEDRYACHSDKPFHLSV